MKLYYWGIKARSFAACVVAKAGGIELELDTNPDLGSLKASGALPFGQVPFLVDGEVSLAQSCAIIRYLARKGGLQGASDAEFARSEMLIEEANDLFNILVKAQYSPEKSAAYDATFAASGPIATQVNYLERILTAPPAAPSAGDFTITCALNLLVTLEPTVLDAFPNVKAFYDVMIGHDAFNPYKDWPMYLSRA